MYQFAHVKHGDYLISSHSVRLADGSGAFEGRVEIFYPVEQEWGTVCDDLWGDSDARVVCSQLGYEGGMAMPEAHFGEGTGSIWLDSVECVGNEEYLSDCGHSEWGQHDCTHAEDASVICGEYYVFGYHFKICSKDIVILWWNL